MPWPWAWTLPHRPIRYRWRTLSPELKDEWKEWWRFAGNILEDCWVNFSLAQSISAIPVFCVEYFEVCVVYLWYSCVDLRSAEKMSVLCGLCSWMRELAVCVVFLFFLCQSEVCGEIFEDFGGQFKYYVVYLWYSCANEDFRDILGFVWSFEYCMMICGVPMPFWGLCGIRLRITGTILRFMWNIWGNCFWHFLVWVGELAVCVVYFWLPVPI